MSRSAVRTCCAAAILVAATAAQEPEEPEYGNNNGVFVNFESPQVRPLALSAAADKLFAVHTADARLSVFSLAVPSAPVLVDEIPVGLEPVSVRVRTADEVWVVNHTSDSVSVVSLSLGSVVDTIACKDEPCDVVFAGTPQKAFVSVAGSREVRVFNATTRAFIAAIPLPALQPRALAVSPDGSKVYVVSAISGNRSTVLPASVAPPQPPSLNPGVGAPPQVGLVVDADDPAYASNIPYDVTDHDVFEIDVASHAVLRQFDGIGTANFGLAVHPTSGDLFVANTDARNLVRFESTLKGHAVENQVTRIAFATGVATKFDLNAGISYANPSNPAAKAIALAQPTDVAFAPGGAVAYVASFGTDRVAKIDPATGAVLARIEIGGTPGATASPSTKRGPRGFAFHPTANRLYVMNRIADTVSVVNTTNDTLVTEVPVGDFDPVPSAIRQGRGFLYDAKLSGNGTMSCASCHVDGDTDREDWDLGDLYGPETTIPDPSNTYGSIPMHPMKGPMFTQTLKGLSQGSNPLHWRGDRADFTSFNSAFDTLMGGSTLSAADMQKFADFINLCDFEPNPNLNLDRSLPATIAGGSPSAGLALFTTGSASTPQGACNNCHHLPLGTGSKIVNQTVLGQTQGLKVPQLRTTYMKTGFNNGVGAASPTGFGFGHDGAVPTVQAFLSNPVTFGTIATNVAQKNDLAAFLMCIDTNTPPAVGYSRTVKATNATSPAVVGDVGALMARAALGEIDVIAKGRTDGARHGFHYVPATGLWQSDVAGYGPFTWTGLQGKALAGGNFTVMGVPFQSGQRMGVDRDTDGTPDGNEEPPYVMEDFGQSTPPCASDIVLSSNSEPLLGNSQFAFTCTHLAPNQTALLIVAAGEGLEPGPEAYGMTTWVDLTGWYLLLPMPADDLGFGFVQLPIPYNLAWADWQFSAMAVTFAPCAPFGVAASHGIRWELSEP